MLKNVQKLMEFKHFKYNKQEVSYSLKLICLNLDSHMKVLTIYLEDQFIHKIQQELQEVQQVEKVD